MSCVGTPMQLASCGAPVKLPAPELGLGFGLDVQPAGRSESTSNAFLACAVWAEVAAAAAGPATVAVETTAVDAPVTTPATNPATRSPAAGDRSRTAPDWAGAGAPSGRGRPFPPGLASPRGPLCLALTTREC